MRKERVVESNKETAAPESEELLLDADTEVEDVPEGVEEVVEGEEEVAVESEDEAAPETEKKAPRAGSHMSMGKVPPPPKDWRIQGNSPEGLTVTLGRYNSKAEADPDLSRLTADGFYTNLRIVAPNGKVETPVKEAKKRS